MKYNNMEQFTPEAIVDLYKKGKSIVDIAHGLNIRNREVIAILNHQGINVHQVEMSYGEKNSLDPANFRLIQIDTPRFSVRTVNCIKKIGVFTAEDLLNCTESDLCNIKGFGKLSLSEVEKFVSELKNGFSRADVSNPMEETSNATNTGVYRADDRYVSALKKAYFYQYRDQIFKGDFSFAEKDDFPEQYADKVKMYEDGYKLLDCDILEQCKSNPKSMALIIGCLLDFSKRQKRKEEIFGVIDRIPVSRKNNLAKYYIVAYTDDKETQDILYRFFANSTILKTPDLINDLEYNDYVVLKSFLSWCTFDLTQEVQELWDASCTRDNVKDVIHLRAHGRTLGEIGDKHGITRERIRQIESKAIRIFERKESQVRFIAKVSAEKGGDPVIHREDIEKYIPSYAREFFFLLENSHNGNFTYDKGLDVLIVGNNSIPEKISAYVESLPDVFIAKKMVGYVTDATELGLPEDLVIKEIDGTYKLTGETYHRSRLSLVSIYRDILSEKYPNGFCTGSATEIKIFRENIKEKYGNVNIPVNDHALAAAVSRIGVLCGKGCYKLKQKDYISKELANRIHSYIEESQSSIFLMNTLYEIFKEELEKEGVDNKYYLQGILHELYGDEFVFTRDYLSKDGEDTSLYPTIVDFIKKAAFQVDRAQIQKHFPGLPDIVIQFAIESPEIINCFGKYIHASKLRISESERDYLKQNIDAIIADGAQHHIKELYNLVTIERPEIFTRNGVFYPFSAYSLIEYLFRDDYKFTRPFIAQHGVEITGTSDVLREEVYSHESYDLKELSAFVNENHLAIGSTLDFIDSCNDEYLMISNQMMMRISSIGVDEQIAQQVGSIVMREVEETTPIYKVMGLRDLPKINVPWTDWLVYSVLKKWPCDIDLATSNKQFRYAIPLVSQKGKMCAEPFEYAYKDPDYNSEIPIFDIDELLAGECGDSILEENLWD